MSDIDKDLKITIDLLISKPLELIIKGNNDFLINKLKQGYFNNYYLPSYINGILNTCEVTHNFNESDPKNKEKLLKIIKETDLYKNHLNYNDVVDNIFSVALDVSIVLRDQFLKSVSIDEDQSVAIFQFINGDYTNLSKQKLLELMKIMDEKNELNIDEHAEKYINMVHGFSHAISDMKTIYKFDYRMLDALFHLKKSLFTYLIGDKELDEKAKKFYLFSELYENDKFFTKEIIDQYNQNYPQEMIDLNIHKMFEEMSEQIKALSK